MQHSAQMFKMEHQSKQAKRNPKPNAAERQQGGRTHGGGGRTFETAKQARSEKHECEAFLRASGCASPLARILPDSVKALTSSVVVFLRPHGCHFVQAPFFLSGKSDQEQTQASAVRQASTAPGKAAIMTMHTHYTGAIENATVTAEHRNKTLAVVACSMFRVSGTWPARAASSS